MCACAAVINRRDQRVTHRASLSPRRSSVAGRPRPRHGLPRAGTVCATRSPRSPRAAGTGSLTPTKTADTVSVLQQAPGTIITRAPDEVQWACGGDTLLAGSSCDDASGSAARYFRYLTRGEQPRFQSSARRRRPLLFIARRDRRGVRLRRSARPDCTSEPATRPPRAARRQLTAAPALTLARPPPPARGPRAPRSLTPPAEASSRICAPAPLEPSPRRRAESPPARRCRDTRRPWSAAAE